MDQTPQDDASDTPAGQAEEGQEPDREFDPDEVENDPSQNPPVDGLKDLKGG